MPRKNLGLNANGTKKPSKQSPSKNPDEINLKAAKAKDAGKVPLRINSNTIIMVKPENRNREYAEQYAQTLNNYRINY